jgi:UDP-N-acetylglucosamine:LPS N-acetylglucosamine transferase
VLPDIDCDAPRLAAILDRWLADPAALDAMGRAAGSLGRPDAADAGARVVEDHARPALQRKGPP